MKSDMATFSDLPGPMPVPAYQPLLKVPAHLIEWRKVPHPHRCHGIRMFLEELRNDGFPQNDPLRARVAGRQLFVISGDWCRRAAIYAVPIGTVPATIVAGDPEDIRKIVDLWGVQRQRHPLVIPDLTDFEGRLYLPEGALPDRRAKCAPHPLFGRFPQAAARAVRTSVLRRNAGAVLLFEDGVAEFLAELLQFAWPDSPIYVLARNGTCLVDAGTAEEFAPKSWPVLPHFKRIFGGCESYDPVTGLAFTANTGWQAALGCLHDTGRIGHDTVRIAIATPRQTKPDPTPGNLCHMVAQIVLGPDGLQLVAEPGPYIRGLLGLRKCAVSVSGYDLPPIPPT